MMAYRFLTLQSGAPTLPAPAAVPGKPTSLHVAHQAQAALDTLMGSGHRVLLELGLRGGNSFMIPSGADTSSGATRIYPDKSTPRVAGRVKSLTITPGHFVAISVVAAPSGPLQKFVVAEAEYHSDGAGGSVEMEVTYTNSDSQSVTVTVTTALAASQEIFAAEPPSLYGSMIVRYGIAIPWQQQASAEHWQKWTRGGDVTVEVTVRYIGSPRIIDLVVFEEPKFIVVDTADSRWPTAMYTGGGGGQPYGIPPSDYPIQQVTSTDPGGGVAAIRRALRSHGRELGPVLFGWSSALEHSGDLADWISYDGGTGDDEAPPASMAGTTPTLLPWGVTTESDDLPGWSTGTYARQVDHGDHFLDGRTGVLPVWVAAYVRVSGGTGTYELRTDDVGWSAIRFTTTSTSWTWVLEPGWLEVGTGPEDAPVARLWAHNSGANDTQIRDLAVFMQVR